MPLMTQPKSNDDDDAFDKNGLLKDGRAMRVPMSAMDGLPREVARHANRLHDGSGNHQLIHHMPGFIVTDALSTDERQRICDAYDEYERDLTTAWKRGAA